MKARIIEIIMAGILLISAAFLPPKAIPASAEYTAENNGEDSTGQTGEVVPSLQETLPDWQDTVHRVVLDAGHGGADPGKIGVTGVLEKEVNLAIVQALQAELEAAGIQVILTRDSDAGLYKETDSHKKQADMKARCTVIEEAMPEIVVSIHQNSYHQSEIEGPQVFYYTGSEQGQVLAELLQESFTEVIGAKNRRQVKPNRQYYLLLHVKQPMVIVECGFLSNPGEEAKLKTAEYQQQIAKCLAGGIIRYFQENPKQ